MKTLLHTLTLLYACAALAQLKPARTNDADAFTNVRSGKGTNTAVVGKLDKTDLFYCEKDPESDWWQVESQKMENGVQVMGYIHKSKVAFLENLSLKDQKTLITDVLTQQKQKADRFRESLSQYNSTAKQWKSTQDSLAYTTARADLELHSENRYNYILNLLPAYYCATKDNEVMQLFFKTLWADSGSANKQPSFTMGDCFVCQPEGISGLLQKISDKEQREAVAAHIEWGLLNIFNENDAQYLALEKKLNASSGE